MDCTCASGSRYFPRGRAVGFEKPAECGVGKAQRAQERLPPEAESLWLWCWSETARMRSWLSTL